MSNPAPTVDNMAMRMNARSVLKDKIERKHKELQALEVLESNIIWDDLTSDEESLLWSYFIESRN